MPNEQLETVSVPASPTPQASSTNADTTQTTAPVASNTQHAANTNPVATTTQQPQVNVVDQGQNNVDQNAQRELNKMSELERERNEYKATATEKAARAAALEEQAQLLSAIEQIYSNDKIAYESMRAAHVRNGGKDPGAWEVVYGGGIQQDQQASAQMNPGYQQPQQPQQIDTSTITQQVMQEMEFNNGVNSLLAKRPELNSSDPEVLKQQHFIANLAGNYKAYNPSLSWADALDQAAAALPNNMQNGIQQARQTGELIGKAQAYATGSSSAGNIGGGTTTNTGNTLNVQMTREQRNKYEVFLKENPDRARRYAENVNNLSSN